MRLINADKIEPHEQLESLGNGQYEYVRVAYMDDIDALPTVDAVPVRKGQWRHYEGVLTCSECGTEYYDDIIEWCGDHVPKFCPDCGADMRKDGEAHD